MNKIKLMYVIYNHVTGLFYLELNKTWVSFNECTLYEELGEVYILIDSILKENRNFCLSVEEFYCVRK